MRIAFEFSGGPELARVLNALPQAVRRKALYPILREAAEPIRARMAQLAPRSHEHAPRKDRPAGHLADHIAIRAATRIGSVAGGKWNAADEFQAAVAVGPTKDYFWGIYLEYGTVHTPPHPFGRPAFDNLAPDALDDIRRGLWDLMAEVLPATTPSSGTGTGTL